MRKLRLDDLAVESFSTADPPAAETGTVGAHQQNPNPTRDWACDSMLTYNMGCGPSGPCWCPTGFTCAQSCRYTECPAQTNIGIGGCAGGGGGSAAPETCNVLCGYTEPV